ncbi:MAG: restriction endonuclease, partial [Candidatus Omnitrophica bacterium]|nr:restriction endonuclease [Candidatus Omnitrophota bacterium]
MAIPDYQSIMLPLLKLAGNQQEHKMKDVTDELANQFKLTEDERKTQIPSGTQSLF